MFLVTFLPLGCGPFLGTVYINSGFDVTYSHRVMNRNDNNSIRNPFDSSWGWAVFLGNGNDDFDHYRLVLTAWHTFMSSCTTFLGSVQKVSLSPESASLICVDLVLWFWNVWPQRCSRIKKSSCVDISALFSHSWIYGTWAIILVSFQIQSVYSPITNLIVQLMEIGFSGCGRTVFEWRKWVEHHTFRTLFSLKHLANDGDCCGNNETSEGLSWFVLTSWTGMTGLSERHPLT